MSVHRIPRRAAVFLVSTIALCAPSWAADPPWPGLKPITWIVGFVPGGSVDVLTRIAARKLSESIGQSVVVDNRPGASGNIALGLAAKAASDGYTLVTVPGPLLNRTRQPEVGQELTAIGMLGQGPMVLVGPAAKAQRDLGTLLESAKKEPKAWSYGSSGNGTSQHLAGELLNAMAGTAMTHVPYRGGAQAVSDVVGGQIPLAMLGVTPVLPHIKSGKLKAYAVTSASRIDSLPDVPTMHEAGIRGYEAVQWYAVAAPKGVPADLVSKLNRILEAIVSSPEMVAALANAGSTPVRGSASDVTAFVQGDLRKWNELAAKSNLDLD